MPLVVTALSAGAGRAHGWAAASATRPSRTSEITPATATHRLLMCSTLPVNRRSFARMATSRSQVPTRGDTVGRQTQAPRPTEHGRTCDWCQGARRQPAAPRDVAVLSGSSPACGVRARGAARASPTPLRTPSARAPATPPRSSHNATPNDTPRLDSVRTRRRRSRPCGHTGSHPRACASCTRGARACCPTPDTGMPHSHRGALRRGA